jgi:CRP-like cAMP-binding protein
MLSGKAQIIKENVLGDSMIIGAVEASDLFGETFACMGLPFIPVSVIALEDCEVLELDINHVVRTCPTSCPFHQQMIFNLLQVMAEKNMFLNKKMSYLTHKTIRSRLEAYFIDCMEQQRSPSFTIAFNRNELAEYLCADRSALSRELAKMQQQGLIDYNGRKFLWKEKALKPKG